MNDIYTGLILKNSNKSFDAKRK